MADEHGPDAPTTLLPHVDGGKQWVGDPSHGRKYLPTFAELVDRLAIVQLKFINIPANQKAYAAEMADIKHDIDLMLTTRGKHLNAEAIGSILMIMLTNHFIWINESKARAGGSEQDHLLKLTHSINGVRNRAKNELAKIVGDSRIDLKVDSLAADGAENWNVFDAPGKT